MGIQNNNNNIHRYYQNFNNKKFNSINNKVNNNMNNNVNNIYKIPSINFDIQIINKTIGDYFIYEFFKEEKMKK